MRAADVVLWSTVLWLFAAGCGSMPSTHRDASSTSGPYEGCPGLAAFPGVEPRRSGPNERCSGPEHILYVDADCDGAGSAIKETVPCDNGLAPIGYSWTSTDCDDNDPTKWRVYNRDADGDGVGSKDVTICVGAEIPPGYLLEMGLGDCDDSNPAISLPYHLDADGDGVPAPNAPIVCGPPGQPPLIAVHPYCGAHSEYCDDCDDTDPTIRTLYYQDLDGDGYAASTAVSVCGSPDGAPPGFGTYAVGRSDCDDSRPDVSPDALDQWTDGVDANCDGHPPFGYNCTSLETCDAGWFTIPIDSTCTDADLVIAEVTAQDTCMEILWALRIGNQGNAAIAESALTIEAPQGSFAFVIRDPLPPGAQYPYRIPASLHLSGQVRFSVTAAVPDCDTTNNAVLKWEKPMLLCPI